MKDLLNEQFQDFHYSNLHVYDKLEEIAREVKATGKEAFGIAAIFERLRWISTFETTGDIYKLNNNYRAFYVRMLMVRNPSFTGFFRMRKSVADRGVL